MEIENRLSETEEKTEKYIKKELLTIITIGVLIIVLFCFLQYLESSNGVISDLSEKAFNYIVK